MGGKFIVLQWFYWKEKEPHVELQKRDSVKKKFLQKHGAQLAVAWVSQEEGGQLAKLNGQKSEQRRKQIF